MNSIKTALAGLVRQNEPGASIDHPHYISLSLIEDWLKNVAFHEAYGVMLDYGCGGQPYKNLFLPKLTKYIGADVSSSSEIELDLEIEPGELLPLSDQSIDTLLSTQTLEHVPDVNFYLGECRRVVKIGGTMLITVPMQWRHHEIPFDYFRFTKYGLTNLLEKNGFVMKTIHPCGGVYALIGQIFLSHLHERGIKKRWLNKCINKLAFFLDKKVKDTEDTLNWMCVAERKF